MAGAGQRAGTLTLVAMGLAAAVQAQTYTVLHRFKFTGGGDGGYPSGVLVLDAAGNIYGTAGSGGATQSGIVFMLDKTGHETVLHRFSGPDGSGPYAGLTFDSAGYLYGTTYYGGSSNEGVVFKLDPTTGTETVLHDFPVSYYDGVYPYGGVTLDSAGNIYGTTEWGGLLDLGTVVALDPTGTETMVYDLNRNGGMWPWSGVILDSEGNIYGTAPGAQGPGGAPHPLPGVVFKLSPTGTFTSLYDFKGANDGLWPFAGVIGDSGGNLYGTTYAGGIAQGKAGYGTVFKLDTSGALTVLHRFSGGADGANPYSGVIQDAAGNLYGATYYGGSGYGVVFKLDTNGKETVLYTFKGGADGANPFAGLVMDSAGNLYGTTYYGGIGKGSAGFGVVFKITL